MLKRTLLGLSTVILIVAGVVSADERGEVGSEAPKTFMHRRSDRRKLREDVANTIFMAEIKVEDLRSKLREAEKELAQIRRSLGFAARGKTDATVLRASATEDKPQSKDDETKYRAQAEEWVDRLEAQVEIMQLAHDTEKAVFQAALMKLRNTEMALKVRHLNDDAEAQAETEIQNTRTKLAAMEIEILERTVKLNAKKRELKAAQKHLGE